MPTLLRDFTEVPRARKIAAVDVDEVFASLFLLDVCDRLAAACHMCLRKRQNLAESSLTLDDAKHIICPGLKITHIELRGILPCHAECLAIAI
jgi:hypothetical protein